MSAGYRFDEVARAERYFVATLFSHFLMANDFVGLRLLFQKVFGHEACLQLNNDFEVVSELDPLRDGSVYNPEVKRLYKEFKRVAVPDLFLRWSSLCLVIEAKFFTDPSEEELKEQVKLQREAIRKVLPYTHYKDWEIKFATLTGAKTREIIPAAGETVLTWDEIIIMMEANSLNSEDLSYCKKVLQKAKERAAKELIIGSVTYEKMNFDDLLARLPQLIAQGKIFVGFTGGADALFSVSEIDELINRSHYKVSDIQWTDNWIPLDKFLQKVFELRGYYNKYNDQDA